MNYKVITKNQINFAKYKVQNNFAISEWFYKLQRNFALLFTKKLCKLTIEK